MGKGEKMKGKLDNEEEEEETRKSVILLTSSDDEEANEDLSLEIVEKSRMREAKRKREERFDEFGASDGARSAAVINLSSSSDEVEVIDDRRGGVAGVAEMAEVKKKKKKKKKKANKTIESEEKTVDFVEAQEQAGTAEAVETVKSVEIEAETVKSVELEAVTDKSMEIEGVEKSDNIVLRKLLRGPRYFDPQDSSWEKCYNCGEEGHKAVNCVSQKRKKPCFVCGSFEHGAKRCTQGQDCFICKRRGHRAKDCPEKHQRSSQSSKICLRCGDIGHEMFSCSNDYSPDDLKEIQCYICKSFGHLCCVDFKDTGPRENSCYNCGQSGHTGLGCAKPRGETSGAGSPTLCYKCGEEGHLARGCTKYSEYDHRMDGFSTPTQRFPKGGRDFLGFKSVPRDLGKAHQKKSTRYRERGITTAGKSKQRGGWITDDPGDFPNRKAKANGWRSPTTPTKKGHKMSASSAGGHPSSSRSPWKKFKPPPGTPGSNGSANSYQHRFSASRFGNSSVGGYRRNYDW